MTNESTSEGTVRVDATVRRCPVCGESDGTMVNYTLGRKELMMHPICAARHYQHALERITDLVCDTNSFGDAVDIANEALGE